MYRKEPVGIVHPYKDDIKMRPVSRIFDKKLVTLDTSPREERHGFPAEGPKKSLSLESLLDVINAEQQQKRQLAKRGCSQQFESIHKFVNGLHQKNGGKPPHQATRPTGCPKTRAAATSTSNTAPVKPSHNIPVKPVKPNQHHYSAPLRRSSHSEERSREDTRDMDCARHYARDTDCAHHDIVRTNPRKSAGDGKGRGEQHRWAENMLHSHQGGHPSIQSSDHRVSRSHDLIRSHDPVCNSRSASSDYYQRNGRQKARRGSDSRARWQPGHTHKWVLDNNTTLLESTL